MTTTCSSCGHVNREGAQFCAGCGAGLAAICPSCGAKLPAGARFCDSCGTAIEAPETVPAPPAASRKTVSIIFADLAGSTELQESLDPESARRVMERFYEAMRAAIEAHDGSIQKFIGDAVVAVFGIPAVGEDDALRAVRAASAMGERLAELNEELERDSGVRLRLRTGVHTGELVLSDEGILVGDAMNTAARLEQAAPEGEVLVGEPTWRLVHHEVELEPVEPLELKGKSEPVRAWRLVSVAPKAPAAAPVETPLIGRSDELDRLQAALADATGARQCRLVTVIGWPGVGKTRLSHEFARAVGDRASVVFGHCEQSGEGITFLPVAEVLREIGGIGEADAPEVVRAKLGALVPDDEPEREQLVERTAGVLGVAEPASVQETFWALRRGLENLARAQPLVLVLDDVHWGEPMFLDLVEHLVEWVSDAPVLIVALARPELREVRETLAEKGRRALDVIDLEPLDEAESGELVTGLLGQTNLPAELHARIVATTEGNPLFLGELLRMLVDEGALVREGDVWVAAPGLGDVEVPPTIQALLAARIERLRADERSVVERAAVIGKQFYRGAVAELVTPPVRIEIDGHLEALRRKDMVEPEGTYWIDEPVYRFHHVLIRDAAYRSLLKEARAELHERFAEWLEEKAGELVGEHEEVIAFHLEQAHEYRRQLGPLDDHGRALGTRAAARLHSAGSRALAREDLAAAANLLGRALACDPADEAEILWELGEATLSAGDTTAAAPVIERLRGDGDGDDVQRSARADVLAAQLANLTGAGEIAATADSAAAATAELARLGDSAGEAKGHHISAQALARLGRVGDVEAELDKALAAARKAEDRRRITAVLAGAPRAALWGPSPVVRASGRCLDVVRILRMTPGNRPIEAVALRCQAVLEAMRGRADAAREILAAGRTTLEELGLSLELHETAIHAGIVELLAGDPVAAEGHLCAARDGFESLGVGSAAAQAAALLARALVDQGRDDEALEQTQFAEERGGEDLKTSITACGVRAEALAHGGEHEQALEFAERGVALAEPTDALPDKADASLALARVLLAAGREAEARQTATTARGLYEEKGHAVGAERAAALAGSGIAAAQAAPRVPEAESGVKLGDLPPERWLAELAKTFADKDAEAAAELYTQEVRFADHRTINWGRLPKDLTRAFRSIFEMYPDIRLQVDEVLACDERVIAYRGMWVGTGAVGGGEFNLLGAFVISIESGRAVEMHVYEADDREAILARYAELGGQVEAEPADLPPEVAAFFARFADLWSKRDVAAITDAYPEELLGVDHRRAGWGDVRGHAGVERQVRSVLEISPDIRFDIDEVLAASNGVVALRVAWRGRSADTGGELETALGWVARVEGERMTSLDFYEPDDREAILARYAELGGRMRAELGDLPPERFLAITEERLNAQDLEPLLALYDEDWIQIDHRKVGWDEVRGREGLATQARSAWTVVPDMLQRIDEVLACDERLIVFCGSWYGRDAESGGTVDMPFGLLRELGPNGWLRDELYDPDDRQAMLARFEELGGRLQAPLGDAPSAKLFAEHIRRFNARDAEAIAALAADDFAYTDHRAVGIGDFTGRKKYLRSLHTIVEGSFEVRADPVEVIACDEGAIAVQVLYRGTGGATDGGGDFEHLTVEVLAVEDGRFTSLDHFEPDDRQAIIARYAQLGGGQSALGDRPPERSFKRYVQAFAARDLDSILGIVAEDWLLTDHRQVGWGELRGREDLAELSEGWTNARDVRLEVDEVLARDDRLLAVRVSWLGTMKDGGGPFSIPIGMVIHPHGMDVYEHEDRDAMLARFRELAGASSGEGELPTERFLVEISRAWRSHDLDTIVGLFSDDYALTDHRMIGWDSASGIEAARERVRSALEVSPDISFEFREVLARDDRVVAAVGQFLGSSEEGGPFEVPIGCVWVVADGKAQTLDMYDPDDRTAIIARFAELGGGQGPLGDSPPERVWSELIRTYGMRDLDALMDLYSDEIVVTDHRPIGWEPVRGREAAAAMFTSGWDASADNHTVVDEVLACDDGVLAVRGRWIGTSDDGGARFEIAIGVVAVIAPSGLLVSCDQYEYGDREAMLARYEELSGGRQPSSATRAPERFLAEFARTWATRDADRIMDLFAEDYSLEDHRGLGWDAVSGKEAQRELVRSAFEMSPDVVLEIDEVIASDEDVVATIVVYRGTGGEGGGPFEIPFGQVVRVDDGRASRLDIYDPTDRTAMIARYADLGGGQGPLGERPPERFWANYIQHFANRDLEAMREYFTEDSSLIDHRALGYGEHHGFERAIEILESAAAASREMRIEVDEVLACDERVIALRHRWCGQGIKAGLMEVPMGTVGVIEDGRIKTHEIFEPDDRDAIMTRYAELSDQRPWALFDQLFNARALDALPVIYTDDFVMADRRTMAWEEIRGGAGLLETVRSALELAPDLLSRCELMADDGGDVALVRNTFTGHGLTVGESAGGPVELVFDMVIVVRDGRSSREELFDPADEEASRARYEELRAEYS